MNCKQGDLAIIVRSYSGNEGKIVRCIKIRETNCSSLLPDGSFSSPDVWWEIDQTLPSWNGLPGDDIADSQLRPIRDPGDDAQDESKAWLPPVPTQTKELA